MKYLILAALLTGCAAKQPAVLPPKIIVVTKTVVQPSRSADVALSPKSETGQAVHAYRLAEKKVPQSINDPRATPEHVRTVYAKEKEARRAVQNLINEDGHRTKESLDRAYNAIKALMDSQQIDESDNADVRPNHQ